MSLILSPAATLSIAPLFKSRLVIRRGIQHSTPLSPSILLIPRRNLPCPFLLLRPSAGLYLSRTIAGIGFGEGAYLHDAGATALVLSGAYALGLAFDNLTQRNIIEQNLSRKLVHILSGLLFMVSWPIFSTSTGARYFAAFVPIVNCLRLLVHGLSLVNNEGLVKSVTREGKPEELLRGPLYYVVILILCVLIFWRESPIGVISLAMMCGGDGIADIIGRRFGSLKIPYNQQKSWAGSISMLVFGFLISIGMLYYFTVLGYFELDWAQTVEKVALVSLVATMVESASTTEVQMNLTMPSGGMESSSQRMGHTTHCNGSFVNNCNTQGLMQYMVQPNLEVQNSLQKMDQHSLRVLTPLSDCYGMEENMQWMESPSFLTSKTHGYVSVQHTLDGANVSMFNNIW